MKRWPLFFVTITTILLALFLIPKLGYLILTVAMAGVIPGTDLSINPVIMFTGAIVGGLAGGYLLFASMLTHPKNNTLEEENKSRGNGRSRRRFTHLKA